MLTHRRAGAICLTIILNEHYDQGVQIAVWGAGVGLTRRSPFGSDWGEMEISRVGVFKDEVYWAAQLPMKTEKFIVLCRTDNAKLPVDADEAYQYCQSARKTKGEKVRYIMTSEDEFHIFSNLGTAAGLPVRLSAMTEEDAGEITPTIYIPKRNELHVTPEKKEGE